MVEEMKVREGYKKTEIGVIPEDWEVVSLGEIGEPIIGLTYKPEDINQSGKLVLRSSNVQNNSLSFDDNVFVDTEVKEKLMVKKDDILICVRNGSRNLIGKCALIDERAIGSTFGAFMTLYRSDKSRYIFQYFQSYIIKKQIDENLGATINQITNKVLNSFLVAIPSNDNEERLIVKSLTDTDNLIQSIEKLIYKKEKIKQGTMQELLTGKKRLDGFSGEWEIKKVGELLSYEQPTNYINEAPILDKGVTPVLTANKAFVLGFTRETHGVFTNIPAIIFDDFTTASKKVEVPFKIRSSALKILKTRNENIDLNFIFETMQILKFRLGDHKRYYLSEYQFLDILIPPLNEQKAISQILSDMDQEIEALQEKLKKYKTIKKAMMQELLTGRVRLI